MQTARLPWLANEVRVTRERARQWRRLLFAAPELLAFFGLNALLSSVLIWRTLQHEGLPLILLAPTAIVGLPLMYTAVFAVLYFSAVTADERDRVVPIIPRPATELAAVLIPVVALALLGSWMLRRGNEGMFLMRDLSHYSHSIKGTHVQLFKYFGLKLPRGIESWYVFFVFPLFAMLALRCSPHSLGFRLPHGKRWSLMAAAGLFAIAVAEASVLYGPRALFAGFAAFIGAGLPEEFFFRALLQTRLEVLLRSSTKALVATSLIFGGTHLMHRETDIVWQLADAFGFKALLGFVFGYLYLRTRSLWPVALFHATIDVAPFAQVM